MELSNLFEHFITCYETYIEKETTENFRWRYHLKIVYYVLLKHGGTPEIKKIKQRLF